MTSSPFNNVRGTLTDDSTLRIQRLLPGPIERVWSHLTDSNLRQQWLASGTMRLQPGASFELVWRNDDLSNSSAERPEGFPAESRATCQFIDVEPPRRMHYIWPTVGEVSIELETVGDEVMLTLTHRQLLGERLILNVCAGWHAHLELLIAHLAGKQPPSLWLTWSRLRKDYEEQLCEN
jgi:uncharacterized protein YndB with AHSA1/START domain